MEQPVAVPQADVLWQSADRTAKFYFTLETHGNDDDAYSRYIAEGPAHAALPKIEPRVWEAISGHVQTFMARLNPPRQLGYSIDLKIPHDVDGRPEGTCTFGCGASEERLRQVKSTQPNPQWSS